MYFGRIGLGTVGPGVSLPPVGIPGLSPTSGRSYYTATHSSLATIASASSTERTYDAAVIAATRDIPVAGGGLDVTRQVGQASPFAPGGRGGSGRSGSAQETYETEEDLTDAEAAQAIDEATTADDADELCIGCGDDISGYPSRSASSQSFLSKYKTPLLVGGLIVGGLVVWKLLR
jgi:hypothetical protein